MPINLSLPKTKAAILYFASYPAMQNLGKVKLMKLLYFLDFSHVKNHGTPILGDQYYHLEKGPIPTITLNLVNALMTDPESSGLSDVISIHTPEGTNMHKIVATREFSDKDGRVLGSTELDMLSQVAKRFVAMNTPDIIELSHQEAPWRLTEYTDPIPYELAAYDPDSKFNKEDLVALNSF